MVEITDDFSSKLDKIIVDSMTENGSPGLSIGIISGDDLIFSRNYGAMDLEKNIAASSDTLYMIASITKSFTALGILKLVELGKISLEDEISKYIPITLGFKEDPIRVKHLLSHSSGIPGITDILWAKNEEDYLGIGFEIPKIPFTSWDDVYRYLNGANEWVTERPGKVFYYNNMCYDLLGRIIEIITNMKFGDFIKEEILNPLQMDQSSFFSETLSNNANLATPYGKDPNSKKGRLRVIEYPEKKFISAAGGLFSSINEMSNYVSMMMNEGNFNGKQIISKDLLSEMQNMQFIEKYPSSAFTNMYWKEGKTGYGYGLAIHENFMGYKMIEHSGSFYGASAWMAMIPEKKLGVVFLSNMHPSPRQFAQAVLMELIGQDMLNHPLLELGNFLDQFVGEYDTYKKTTRWEVKNLNGALYLKFSNPNAALQPLYPEDGTFSSYRYYVPTPIGGRDPVCFEKDENGQMWLHWERTKLRKV